MKLQGIDLDVAHMGSGPSMLMLHGVGGPVVGMPFATRLAEKFEIIAPVHLGFAGTRIPDHFDCIDDLVYLYLDLLDELDLRETLLVGFSMGGWVAAEMATMTTERLSRLALVNSVGVKVGGRDDRDITDVFAGTPDQIYEQIKGFWEYSGGFGHMMIMGQAGFLSDADALKSMRLYTNEVYPRLRELTEKSDPAEVAERSRAMADKESADLGNFGIKVVR